MARRSRKNMNPNQMALPGMEELSHPGAKALAEEPTGMFFHHGPDKYDNRANITFAVDNGPNASYDPRYPSEGRPRDYIGVGHMAWNAGPAYKHPLGAGQIRKGEIEDLHVDSAYRRKGIAAAMFNVSRQMLPYMKPTHSPERTRAGDSWARAVGGRLPKLNAAEYNPLMDD